MLHYNFPLQWKNLLTRWLSFSCRIMVERWTTVPSMMISILFQHSLTISHLSRVSSEVATVLCVFWWVFLFSSFSDVVRWGHHSLHVFCSGDFFLAFCVRFLCVFYFLFYRLLLLGVMLWFLLVFYSSLCFEIQYKKRSITWL